MAPGDPPRTAGTDAGGGGRTRFLILRTMVSLALIAVALLVGARSLASASTQVPGPGGPVQSPPPVSPPQSCPKPPPQSLPRPPRWIRPTTPRPEGLRPGCTWPLPGPIRS